MISTTDTPPVREPAKTCLSEDFDPTSLRPTGFNLNVATWPVKSWKQTLLDVIKVLPEDYRDELFALPREDTRLGTKDEESKVANQDRIEQNDPALWVYVTRRTKPMIGSLRDLFDYLNFDKDNLIFEFSKESVNRAVPVAKPTPSPYESITTFASKIDAGEDTPKISLLAFKEFTDDKPLETLGGEYVEDFLQEKRAAEENLIAKEILAVISIYASQANMIRPESLHPIVESGHLAKLLRTLENAE